MPFTVEEFFSIFSANNSAIWPLQILAYAAGVAVIALLAVPSRASRAGIMLLLSAMWAANGIWYHLKYFSGINTAVRAFAFLFVAEAAVAHGGAIYHAKAPHRPHGPRCLSK